MLKIAIPISDFAKKYNLKILHLIGARQGKGKFVVVADGDEPARFYAYAKDGYIAKAQDLDLLYKAILAGDVTQIK